MYPLKEMRALCALCGGREKFALKLGVAAVTIDSWAHRSNIPKKYWVPLCRINSSVLNIGHLRIMVKEREVARD